MWHSLAGIESEQERAFLRTSPGAVRSTRSLWQAEAAHKEGEGTGWWRSTPRAGSGMGSLVFVEDKGKGELEKWEISPNVPSTPKPIF